MKELKKFNYRYTGSSVAYGPIYGFNKKDAKNRHRKALRKKLKSPSARLPNGFELWEVR